MRRYRLPRPCLNYPTTIPLRDSTTLPGASEPSALAKYAEGSDGEHRGHVNVIHCEEIRFVVHSPPSSLLMTFSCNLWCAAMH